MSWYEKAMEEIEDEYSRGEITVKEYRAAIRDLNAEIQSAAEEAAERAYDDVMGSS